MLRNVPHIFKKILEFFIVTTFEGQLWGASSRPSNLSANDDLNMFNILVVLLFMSEIIFLIFGNFEKISS